MSSANSRKSSLLTLGKIVVLMILAAAMIRAYFMTTSANFLDSYGLIFVLVGGVALVMIGFPGAEIRRALVHAVRAPGESEEIRHSAYFWEAAARSFWILGALGSVLNLMFAFEGMKTEQVAGIGAVIDELARCLLSTFYGTFLAVICLIPYWKLAGAIRNQQRLPQSEPGEPPVSTAGPGWVAGIVIGYVLFLSVFALIAFHFSFAWLWRMTPVIFYGPSLLMVFGGALVLMLFAGGAKSGSKLSVSFAAMGLIGALMGCIQILFSIAAFGRSGSAAYIGEAARGVTFILSSCFAALVGMILVGAPLADHAIRRERVAAPSAFSRVSWYAFPLLTLILVPLVTVLITTPLPRPKPQVTEVFAPVQEQRARYEARAPQSDPIDFTRASIEKGYLIYRVNPIYPEQAKREGIRGTVKLTVIINEEGFVYEVKGNPENNPVLEKAAIPAVKRWRFRPFLMKDVPVALETTITVNFK